MNKEELQDVNSLIHVQQCLQGTTQSGVISPLLANLLKIVKLPS